MKAIRVHAFGEPSVMKLEEVPDPAPGLGQVVVDLKAVGVNPVDTYIRKGIYGARAFPYTPGMDGAGVVSAVGPDVTAWKVGDRVYVFGTVTGTYAERTLCPAAGVQRLPDHVTFPQGAALGVPYATAHRALFHRGKALAGETVLIHGATGGVGIAAVQLANALGLTVIGTGGTARGRELILKEGAAHALDHRDPTYLDQLLTLTGGRGVDLILEMASNVNLGKDLTVLAKEGRVVVVGSRGEVQINPREAMRRDADIRGMTLMNATEKDLAGIHAAILAGLEARTLRPVVGSEVPLAEVARAHEEVISGKGTLGKIVLIP